MPCDLQLSRWNITVIFNFVGKWFFLWVRVIKKRRGGLIYSKELAMEARIGFREFSQGSKCVGGCEGCLGAVEVAHAAELKCLTEQ
jgi:hypothetical protein